MIGVASPSHADPNDYAACVAQQYDRLRTDGEIASTIQACTRVLESASVDASQRAHALYFRGLNYFLDAVRLAVAERQALGSGSAAVQRLVSLAVEDLTACIAAAPALSAFPFSLRATIRTAMEEYDAALEDLGQAIRIDPKTSSHYVQRALILERRDQFSEARADLDTAVSVDGTNQNAWINRARLWSRYGDIDQAIADYGRGAALEGAQTWSALSGRAKLWVRLAEPLRAYADWTKAADLSPLPTLAAQFHVAAGNLARDYLKQADKAELSYRRALDVLPNYPDAIIQRGIYYERQNRFTDALNAYKKAIELTRDDPLERPVYQYARYRLEILQSRLSRKAQDGSLPPNINVLSRSVREGPRDRTRRVALVVGNAAYAHVAPLMNADRDAESVAEALSEAGFARVTVATNLDKRQLETVLQQFSGEAAEADWALIYYAGHGIEAGTRNFLIPVDASLDTLRAAGDHAVSIDTFLRAAGSAKKLRLVALDACRDNPFVQEVNRVAARNRTAAGAGGQVAADRENRIGGGFAGVQIAELNTIVLYSTQPGRVALDGDELNSPFTRAFVKNMPVPDLDLRLFFERVRDDVAQATERRQWPSVIGRLQADQRWSFFPI